MAHTDLELRPVWKDLLILYPIALIATLPYGGLLAREDGLQGDLIRTLANAAAAGLGFWFFGAIAIFARRKRANRFVYAIVVVVIFAGLASLTAIRRI